MADTKTSPVFDEEALLNIISTQGQLISNLTIAMIMMIMVFSALFMVSSFLHI